MRLYLAVLRTRWRWVAGGVLAALLVGTAIILLAPARYRCTATLFVRTPGDVTSVIDGGNSYAVGRARTYAALAGSAALGSRVRSDLDPGVTPEDLTERITATNPSGTALIDLSFTGGSPDETRSVARVYLDKYTALVEGLEAVPGSLVPRAELVTINEPTTPVRISAWGKTLLAALCAVALAGVVLGALAAVISSLTVKQHFWRFRTGSSGSPPEFTNGGTTDAQIAPAGDTQFTGVASPDPPPGGGHIATAQLAAAQLAAGTEPCTDGGAGPPAQSGTPTAVAMARHWKSAALVTSAVIAGGLVLIATRTPVFVSSTQLMVFIAGSTTSQAYQNDDVARQRVNSYLPLLTSTAVGQRVVDELALDRRPEELAENVSATRVPPNTSIIDVAVSAASPTEAIRLADTYANEFIGYTAALETPTGADEHKVHVTKVSGPSTPRTDLSLRVRLTALTVALGVVLGACTAWARSRKSDDRVVEPLDSRGA